VANRKVREITKNATACATSVLTSLHRNISVDITSSIREGC